MPKTLDINAPPEVQYCIPLWLRDEQIKLAITRVPGRIAPFPGARGERVAVACYGPSLNDTWEQLKDFRYVISCSGSHKFLVERAIIPTWHVEVDPRPHKVQLIGPPCVETEYLIASTCHQAVFDHLSDYKVKLWHVFDNAAEALRTLPAGEWAIQGGCSVGLRAMGIAAFLGFDDVHVFGMDGSEGKSGKHAAAHPNQPSDYSEVVYDGVTYRTTSSMLAAAQGTWHELNQLPNIGVHFYGEGLVQHMARNYQRKEPQGVLLENPGGFRKAELISGEYRELNARLHRENLAYGVGGDKHAKTVVKFAERIKTKDILDYGCGKGRLQRALPFHIAEYDPAIPGKEESPKPADLVICTDVLEHIEPEKLFFVLSDLARCVRLAGYFTIHMGPAQKVLADGRNAHLIQKGRKWWEHKLRQFFRVGKVFEVGPELHVLVGPKLHKKKAAA